jgi:FemAB-related protein (PEP-CTERM system-associated)
MDRQLNSNSFGQTPRVSVHVRSRAHVGQEIERLTAFMAGPAPSALSRHPAWLQILHHGLRHDTFLLEAVRDRATVGVLPLAFVQSVLFGRFLVSLPYLNSGGIWSPDEEARRRLIERAADLADELCVRYLELRHEEHLAHPLLTAKATNKVHLRLALPDFPGPLWEGLKASVRNQVRKGQKRGLSVTWGRRSVLPEFYAVFCENMRDLGTPVYGIRLFAQILRSFGDRAEICVVRMSEHPIAAALLLHGDGVTEVPSASSLREFNDTCANMLMYWHLLERAIDRGQKIFDFGRSTPGSGTYRFKAQWGAQPKPAIWQYYVRRGAINAARPDNPRYQRMIKLWQRLPVGLTRLIGPPIVRGIP